MRYHHVDFLRGTLNRIARTLPEHILVVLKRSYYARQIKRGRFISPEKEFVNLARWVSAGDWVLDVGANVGHYTRALSEIVGGGRVVAVEPNAKTFAYLACNTSSLPNVTLINAAATDSPALLRFSVPNNNSYQGRICEDGDMEVLGIDLGTINFPDRIAFIKIDVEGHDMRVLESLEPIIRRDSPVVMVENHGAELMCWAQMHGYQFADIAGSHNHVLVSKVERLRAVAS